MAVYNELQVGRYVRFLQKFFGIKGRQPAPLTFTGEIGAVLALMHGNENRYLEGWALYGLALGVTGGAAQLGATRFRNPSNSGVVAVFHKLSLANQSGADNIRLQLTTTNTDLTSVAAAPFRFDSRGQQNSTIVASTTTNFTFAGATIHLVEVAINVQYDVILDQITEIPLLPGDALTISAGAVATTLNTSAWWRERILEDGELK